MRATKISLLAVILSLSIINNTSFSNETKCVIEKNGKIVYNTESSKSDCSNSIFEVFDKNENTNKAKNSGTIDTKTLTKDDISNNTSSSDNENQDDDQDESKCTIADLKSNSYLENVKTIIKVDENTAGFVGSTLTIDSNKKVENGALYAVDSCDDGYINYSYTGLSCENGTWSVTEQACYKTDSTAKCRVSDLQLLAEAKEAQNIAKCTSASCYEVESNEISITSEEEVENGAYYQATKCNYKANQLNRIICNDGSWQANSNLCEIQCNLSDLRTDSKTVGLKTIIEYEYDSSSTKHFIGEPISIDSNLKMNDQQSFEGDSCEDGYIRNSNIVDTRIYCENGNWNVVDQICIAGTSEAKCKISDLNKFTDYVSGLQSIVKCTSASCYKEDGSEILTTSEEEVEHGTYYKGVNCNGEFEKDGIMTCNNGSWKFSSYICRKVCDVNKLTSIANAEGAIDIVDSGGTFPIKINSDNKILANISIYRVDSCEDGYIANTDAYIRCNEDDTIDVSDRLCIKSDGESECSLDTLYDDSSFYGVYVRKCTTANCYEMEGNEIDSTRSIMVKHNTYYKVVDCNPRPSTSGFSVGSGTAVCNNGSWVKTGEFCISSPSAPPRP